MVSFDKIKFLWKGRKNVGLKFLFSLVFFLGRIVRGGGNIVRFVYKMGNI